MITYPLSVIIIFLQDNLNPSSSSSAPSRRVGSPSDSGSGSEEVGDAQDEEPSSSSRHHNVESELDNFRRQWKREIELSPSKENEKSSSHCIQLKESENIEEKVIYSLILLY